MVQMDKRIAELKARLHRKRALQQQRLQQRQESEKKLAQQQQQDVVLHKQDPKYQTLPYSIKFGTLDDKKNEQNNNDFSKQVVTDVEEIKIDFPPAGIDTKDKKSTTGNLPSGNSTIVTSTTTVSSSSMGISASKISVSKSNTVTSKVNTGEQSRVSTDQSHKTATDKTNVPSNTPKSRFNLSNLAPRPYGSTANTVKSMGKFSDSVQPATPSSNNGSFMPVSPVPNTSTPIVSAVKNTEPVKEVPKNTKESDQGSANRSKNVTVSSGTSSALPIGKERSPPPYPGIPDSNVKNQDSVQDNDSFIVHSGVSDQSSDAQYRVMSPVSHERTDSNSSYSSDAKNVPYQTPASPQRSQQSESRAPRYASTGVIANTYTSRLSQAAMEKYQKNMNQLYNKDKWSNSKSSVDSTNSEQSGPPPGRPFSPSFDESSNLQRRENKQFGSFDSNDGARYRGNPPPYPASVVEPERTYYHPNAPRPLRIRRPSLGEADDPRVKHSNLALLSPSKQNKTPSPQGSQQARPTTDVSQLNTLPEHPVNKTSTSQPPQPQTSPVKLEQKKESDQPSHVQKVVLRQKKSNVRNKGTPKGSRRVSFDPLALLLDASLEGELELVMRTAREVRTKRTFYYHDV